MSSTPLLSAAGGLPGPNVMQDHPAFLRVSHSPWQCIPQNVLVVLRGMMLAYLTAVAAMIGHYKHTEESEDSPWRHLFDFGLISYALVSSYHLITFSWTFTHLYYPDADGVQGGVESWIVRAMSLPANMGSLRKQFYFTLFYATATVFSFMNSSVYWFVTRQHDTAELLVAAATATGKGASPALLVGDGPFSDLFGEGWFKPFIICNLYGVTSALMILETIFLNSTKRPATQALGSHFFGLVVYTGLYLAWAALGKAWTDVFPFFWLDEEEVGSKEAVTAYCMGFVLLSQFMYTMMLGFVGIREGVTRSLAERAGSIEALEG
ncbi:hypothetical protein HRG_001169 [Hirsutella rhossiliensis]|uniref:Uncharacterized protein n=1 Tax=Hirsutella rhossiliensis TaxID=111463 RepID=A0A9P8N8K7_9HYPO|nr:uncharacterized protein HRG_01169 [Hirsutella rhossiliensis]KAH0968527.1 hypothetical protein HRG_01169 [Hirsutella rhossiliensis]